MYSTAAHNPKENTMLTLHPITGSIRDGRHQQYPTAAQDATTQEPPR